MVRAARQQQGLRQDQLAGAAGVSGLAANTENEAYAMRLGARIGLEVAGIQARAVAGRKYFRRFCTFPAIGVLKLLDAAIFQVLLGNANAHARNYSLLWRRTGELALAPLYDLMSTVSYPQLPAKFAMKIAERETLEELVR